MSLSACGGNRESAGTEIVISAAASLKDALTAIETKFQQSHPGTHLVFNFGSSGTLQKQIEEGAPVDLFISAGQKQIDELNKQKLIEGSGIILRNQLVLIVPKSAAGPLGDIKTLSGQAFKKIAVGEPATVPAGAYTQQSLESYGMWESLKSKLVYAKDVRQVLTYVETGNADAGFVYRTDALTSDKVAIAMPIPPDKHKPIVYVASVVKQSKHADAAGEVLNYLKSEEARAVFAGFGFTQ
ncbi:molybdate ABC transporter substrate-binding protein [Paenibacillus sp. sptzw28]|uniref:molybdate ABC transporter substrate-binding protein n=1 Tax=Paenibacillus sp. sptzw28 TaxID=715179 RepID=UPI00216168E3|nr:molybdate ABC transporter substrate-binding protein [Paenibacillus sp. sptzw28]